ncbi:MAG: maltose alpha-D-glucosyltransferase [Planctomycetes bacterium]|nr:maltose alpha-D-glucosyltransferase [Planctomycetota bacterium]
MQDAKNWYKDAIIYELHVRSFYDSIGDGMGDFGGLTQKLGYLQDLGVTALWLLPFYPSPLKDDGYDIADYRNIHPQYGTLETFREFLQAAHLRGIKVITELVLNHTSDQHPWFQRARRAAPGSADRDFYVWSDTPDRYPDVPIVFKDFEPSNWTFDRVANAYYWHRFYSHQPDLNFDNPAVIQAILPIVDFWFELGVDGMRLDAVPYLFEREGTTCAGLPETHAFLQQLRSHIDSRFSNRMLLAEANVWPEEAVSYFGDENECHMAFHFPVMPRLFMGMFREDSFPIIDILQQTPAIPESCQWALFLRNHDELTLEMVTDEEREAMYRAYARDSQARINVGIRRRLAPLLSNDRRRIELMNGLLFSLPGTPVIYYGDEIGMGDNIFLGDRNSVRTPMQWSSDRNAGFSRANPQRLFLPITIDPEYHYESVNVEAQQNNPHSLLWWMKRLIDIRKRTRAFSRGTLEFLRPANRKILAFLRQYDGQTVLVLANLSRFVQYAQLDLSAFEGCTPVELFGGTRFPVVGTAPYLVMLGPHTFNWFELCVTVPEQTCPIPARTLENVTSLDVHQQWTEIVTRDDDVWERLLSQFLECRLTEGTSPSPVSHSVVYDWVELPIADSAVRTLLLLVDLQRMAGEPQRILLPLSFVPDSLALTVLSNHPENVLARIVGGDSGIVFDSLTDTELIQRIMTLLTSQSRLRSNFGNELSVWHNGTTRDLDLNCSESPPRLIEIEQFNVSAVFHERMVLKILTHVGEGAHPEVEFGQFFSRCGHTVSVAPLLASIEVRGRRQSPMTLAVLHEYIANDGDLWQYTLDVLSVYFERIVTREPQVLPADFSNWRLFTPCPSRLDIEPGSPDELLNEYLDVVRVLATRTAEMHAALANCETDSIFSPEKFTFGYQQSIYQAMRGAALDVMENLEQSRLNFSTTVRHLADQLLGRRAEILEILHRVVEVPLDTIRIRCHGDFHLGQILLKGRDCVMIDFEGNPRRSIAERRIKRSPLRDIATMLRSLESGPRIAFTGLATGRGRMPGMVRVEDQPCIGPWCDYWRARVSAEFLTTYISQPAITPLLPKTTQGICVLLNAFLIQRSLGDTLRAIRSRPDWLSMDLESALAHITDAQATLEKPVH